MRMSFWLIVVVPALVVFLVVLTLLNIWGRERDLGAPVQQPATRRPVDLFADLPPRQIRTRWDRAEKRLFDLWYQQGYLRSSNWKLKKRRILQRAGHRCERCRAEEKLDVHHKTYERLRYELPEDLEALCRECHREAHANNPNLRLY